jgi:nucleoside 2-deoxyribosyltransferase
MRVFTLMSYDQRFNNVFDAIEQACAKCADEARAPNGSAGPPPPLANLDCERADEDLMTSVDLVARMKDKIKRAAFCIAEVTGLNQNVMWELGFAMALEKPVIILTQNRKELGFDLSHVANLEYSATDLKKTLIVPLCRIIKEVASNITTTPSLAASAKALAMSSGSPSYFLDANYQIHYMNEAASALFATSTGGGGRVAWTGQTLREFINSFSRRLKNLAAIERNLQIQKQEIVRLVSAGRPDLVCPYNIERVVLDSEFFGELELQKTGIAVRDPVTDEITGWVVSFNAVAAKDPTKYRDFHLTHQRYIEGQLGVKQTATHETIVQTKAAGAPGWPDGPIVRSWIADGCQSPQTRFAKDYAEKQECFDFCSAVMMFDQKRYGLESISYLNEWFFDYHNADFIMLKSPQLTNYEGELIGVFRIHYNHDLRTYQTPDGRGIEEWVMRNVEDGQPFADVGAYLHPSISSQCRAQMLAIMLGCAVDICERSGHVHLYAQVPAYLASRFRSFLFRRAGMDFHCDGWQQKRWTPMVLKCVAYPKCYNRGAWDLGYAMELMGPGFSESDLNREFVGIAASTYQKRQDDPLV